MYARHFPALTTELSPLWSSLSIKTEISHSIEKETQFGKREKYALEPSGSTMTKGKRYKKIP